MKGLDEVHGKHTPRRQAFATPTHRPKSNVDLGVDESLAEGRLPPYMAIQIITYRKQIARRHAKRKVERKSRQRNRR